MSSAGTPLEMTTLPMRVAIRRKSDAIRRNQTQSNAIPPLAQHDTLWCMCSPAIGAIIFHTTVAIDGAWITK